MLFETMGQALLKLARNRLRGGSGCNNAPLMARPKTKAFGQRSRLLQRRLYADRKAAIRRCLKDGLQLRNVADRWKRDATVVLAAVTSKPYALKYVDKRLRGCRWLVLQAVLVQGAALRFASHHLRNDNEVVSRAAEQNRHAFVWASDRCKSDRALALQLLGTGVKILEYLSEALRMDHQIVLAAVSKHASAWTSAPLQVRGDKDFILQACLARPTVLQYVEPELMDKELSLQAIKQRVDCACYVPQDHFLDLAFATEACQHSGRAFLQCGPDLRAMKDLALLACSTYGPAIMSASPALRRDRDVVLKAVSQDGRMILHGSDELRSDREVMLAAATQNPDALRMGLPRDSWERDLPFMVELCKRNGSALEYANWALRQHRELVLAAIQNDGRAIEWAGVLRQADKDLTVIAAQNTYLCWNLLKEEHWADPDVLDALPRPQRQRPRPGRVVGRLLRTKRVCFRLTLLNRATALLSGSEARPLGAWKHPRRCSLGPIRLQWR